MCNLAKVVHVRIAEIAARAPHSVALIAAERWLDYADLDARADRLARLLIERGIGAESLVAIGVGRTFDRVVAMLATWKAGGAVLPLDPDWPAERLETIAADAECALFIGNDDVLRWLSDAAIPCLNPATATELAPSAVVGLPLVDPAQLAYVIYTSGSTGTPKGVEITHANLSSLIDWHLSTFAVSTRDRAAHLAGLGFDAAIWEVWPHLCAGAAVAFVDDAVRTSGPALREWLTANAISIAFVPTALAEHLIAEPWPNYGPLRLLLTGADQLVSRPIEGLPFALVNNYGPTECTVVATSAVVPPGNDTRPPPIGRSIAGTQIHLLDPAGAEVPAGAIGEIYVGGTGVGRGYRGRSELTAERFVPDPFSADPNARLYRTGDLGSRLPDGEIAFHGRLDDQLKVRGHRVEPGEVAAALKRHPAVRECAVLGQPATCGPARLAAYVVLAGEGAATADDLNSFLGERLPDYMVPQVYVRLERLPLNSSGKLDRVALPAPNTANALPAAGFVAPETAAQQRLSMILSDVLGRGPVGIDDNFFLLGGHSLLGTQVVLRANAAFGVELSLRHLFRAPTIRQMVAVIQELLVALVEAISDEEARGLVAA